MGIRAILRSSGLAQLTAIFGLSALAVLSAVNSSAGIQGSGRRSFAAIGTIGSIGTGVTVGGVVYSTDGATIEIDGQPGKKGQLRRGYVVTLRGDVTESGQASASEITFNGSVQGTVAALDPQSGSFFVLGQAVHVDSNTLFSNPLRTAGLAGMHNGDVVEVSGYTDSTGELLATRVNVENLNSPARIAGSVHSLDTAAHTFRINSLSVDYRAAETTGKLTEGAPVVVEGTSLRADGTLVAARVEVVRGFGVAGADGRVEGVITSFASSNYFEVNGQPVAVGAHVKMNLQTPLGLDVAVRVTGVFDSDGVLVATRVQDWKKSRKK